MTEKTKYVLTWEYYDGSGSGVLSALLSDRDVRLIKFLEKEGMMDSSKKFKIEALTVDLDGDEG